MAYTGRRVEAVEAVSAGLVNKAFESREALQAGVREMAATVASKSPLSIRGTKEMLNYARDHSVADGLSHIATWNAGMLMSADLMTAMMASMSKQQPEFKD
jgi:enoyl-CoA hydratase